MTQPVPPWAWRAGGLALGTASALGVARFAYGLLVPAMRDDLHWTLGQAGAMSTANGLGYLLGALVTAAVVRGQQPYALRKAARPRRMRM